MVGARIFVTIAFLILGASFFASTGILLYEFQETDWQTILVAHAHLFFFFPVLGVLALFAFYLPAVVFTHFYWNHVRWGKVRFLFGAFVVAALSIGVTIWLDQPPRGIWELSPRALASDRGDPAGGRGPILQSLQELRIEAHKRVGLSKFARSCAVDRYLEQPEDMAKVRYCFPARAQLKGPECCAVQARFGETVTNLYQSASGRSTSALYDVFFMPLKIFFVLVVVAIAILLAIWRDRIDQHYRELIPRLERGIIVGAAAMLFWPAMDYGYQQTTNVLFGRMGDGFQFRLSLVLAPWALLLLFYFLRRLGKQGEMVGQISGVVVAAVAVLRYEQLNDTVGRLFGIGAETSVLISLIVLSVIGLLVLLWFRYRGKGPAYPTAETQR
jgi:hypothetical protein